ncbi:MAG: hypothetical protein ACRBN8_30450 [Nannocystales bacterium]
MHVVFCRPRCRQKQEDGFELEADVLDAMGVESLWTEMEAVEDGQLDSVLETASVGAGETLLRSWMLREEEYAVDVGTMGGARSRRWLRVDAASPDGPSRIL